MNRRFPDPRSVCLALVPMLAIACGESAEQVSTSPTSVERAVPRSSLPVEATTTVVEQAATTESPSTSQMRSVDELPLDAMHTLVEQLPVSLGVEGAVVGVTKGDQLWLGAAGIDDAATGAPMATDRRFTRRASRSCTSTLPFSVSSTKERSASRSASPNGSRRSRTPTRSRSGC